MFLQTACSGPPGWAALPCERNLLQILGEGHTQPQGGRPKQEASKGDSSKSLCNRPANVQGWPFKWGLTPNRPRETSLDDGLIESEESPENPTRKLSLSLSLCLHRFRKSLLKHRRPYVVCPNALVGTRHIFSPSRFFP